MAIFTQSDSHVQIGNQDLFMRQRNYMWALNCQSLCPSQSAFPTTEKLSTNQSFNPTNSLNRNGVDLLNDSERWK